MIFLDVDMISLDIILLCGVAHFRVERVQVLLGDVTLGGMC